MKCRHNHGLSVRLTVCQVTACQQQEGPYHHSPSANDSPEASGIRLSDRGQLRVVPILRGFEVLEYLPVEQRKVHVHRVVMLRLPRVHCRPELQLEPFHRGQVAHSVIQEPCAGDEAEIVPAGDAKEANIALVE